MLTYSNSELTLKVSSEGAQLSYVLVRTHHSQHQTATMHSSESVLHHAVFSVHFYNKQLLTDVF